MFCPQAVVWGDVASWVSAVAALLAIIGVLIGYFDFRDRKKWRADAITARCSGIRADIDLALTMFEGIMEGFRGIASEDLIDPWLSYVASNVLSLEPAKLRSSAESNLLPPNAVEWALIAAGAIEAAQRRIHKAQEHPEHFRLMTAVQNGVAENVRALREASDVFWGLTYPGKETASQRIRRVSSEGKAGNGGLGNEKPEATP